MWLTRHLKCLGSTSSNDVPASIRRMGSFRIMVDTFGFPGALYQCALEATSQKPTRLASNLQMLEGFLSLGWPSLNNDKYT
eukprot:6801264-Karenia_brevis.AAC.1